MRALRDCKCLHRQSYRVHWGSRVHMAWSGIQPATLALRFCQHALHLVPSNLQRKLGTVSKLTA